VRIRDVGVGLALGVLTDTFIVRTALVPCTVILLGRWNWWPSNLSRGPAVGRGRHRAGHRARGAAEPLTCSKLAGPDPGCSATQESGEPFEAAIAGLTPDMPGVVLALAFRTRQTQGGGVV
jgi:RND superfamily putative drug exporter